MWNIAGKPVIAVKPTSCLSDKQMRCLPEYHHQKIKAQLWQVNKLHNHQTGALIISVVLCCVCDKSAAKGEKKKDRLKKISSATQQSKTNKIWKWNATPTEGKESKEKNVCETERGVCHSPCPQVRFCYSVSVSHLRVQMRICTSGRVDPVGRKEDPTHQFTGWLTKHLTG